MPVFIRLSWAKILRNGSQIFSQCDFAQQCVKKVNIVTRNGLLEGFSIPLTLDLYQLGKLCCFEGFCDEHVVVLFHVVDFEKMLLLFHHISERFLLEK